MRVPSTTPGQVRAALSPWRFVLVFGMVAMLADVVYEGARSVSGPFLASLGASAAAVGLITGAGEAAGLAGRLVSGPLTDRWGHPWRWTFIGYTLTVLAVPALGLATTLGLGAALLVAERAGKAVRAPAKDALLAHAGTDLGRGRAFAVHEILDQAGAFVGPLAVAGVLAATGSFRSALGALAIPGLATLLLLAWLARRVPDPARYEHIERVAPPDGAQPPRLPAAFWRYAVFAALTMVGFATFGLVGFHLATTGLVSAAAVPVVYAAAMAADAVAAAVTGLAYDRWGVRILVVLPLLAVAVPALAFGGTRPAAVAGVLVWGAALGMQESTLRAVVADLVPAGRRASAYGVFAAVYGVAWALGAGLIGILYQTSYLATVGFVAAVQAAALAVLATVGRAGRRPPDRDGSRGS
jgi:MFS family permease